MPPKLVRPYNCQACPAEDNDTMVQCDVCDTWYHFSCVGVDSSIEGLPWMCNACASAEAAASKTSAPAQSQQLRSCNQQAATVKSPPSLPAAVPSTSAHAQSQQLGSCNQQAAAVKSPASLPAAVPSSSTPGRTQPLGSGAETAASVDIDTWSPPPTSNIKKQIALRRLEEENQLRLHHLRQKYEILALDSDDDDNEAPQQKKVSELDYIIPQQQHVDNMSNWPISNSPPMKATTTTHPTFPRPIAQVQIKAKPSIVLTANQLAARSSMSPDLPIFNGNPEEWELFINSYEQTTELAGFSDAENIVRLRKCLQGAALQAVRHRLTQPAMVTGVINTLRMLFGRADHVIESLIARARNTPPPKPEKLSTLVDYALAVESVYGTIESTNSVEYLNNSVLLREFVNKLPAHLIISWAQVARDLHPPTLADFNNWLTDLVAAVCSVMVLPQSCVSVDKRISSNDKRSGRQDGQILAHADVRKSSIPSTSTEASRGCGVCQADHPTFNCSIFKGASLSERWQMIRQNNLCRSCLGKHTYSRCKIAKTCNVGGCSAKHHPLMHKYANQVSSVSTGILTHKTHNDTKVLFHVLPVTLFANGKSVNTFAFLDGGSSLTLLDEEIANELKLPGRPEELCLRWTSNTTRVETGSRVVSLSIAGRQHGSSKFHLTNVHTIRSLDLPIQSVGSQVLAKRYRHLAGLPLPSYNQARPRILIGMDNWKLGVPLKVFEGNWSQPIATKTRLGWSVHGPDGHCQAGSHFNLHMCECTNDVKLHQLVNGFFSIENVGIRVPTQQIMNEEERRATSILDSTCVQVDGHFEVGLLWKFDKFSLPDSLQMAYRRNENLQRVIGKNNDLRKALSHQITNLVTKGYAKKLSPEELSVNHERTWYLPIFIVRNPNKPAKIRLVWDAAARCQGTSLNDFLLKGPDQLVPLLSVLYGFRCRKIGICGDIAEMFHQIRVREEDRHVQRFLWSDDAHMQKPSVYEMNVMTFGAACSPCIAHYVKNKNAMTFASRMPRAVEAVLEHHYVDDFIDSVDTESEAIQLAKDVAFIHRNAGFHIRNWVSNSNDVLAALEQTENSNKAFGDAAPCETEKILGLYWNTTTDTFTYVLKFQRLKRDVFNCNLSPTKREVLKILMSVFDPMGFLSHFLIGLKILLQQIWRTSIGWDDELPTDMADKWRQLTTILKNATSVNVPRCYSALLREPVPNIQLHTFVDASENAYAAVSYFRIEAHGLVDIALVSAKAKVAPQRPISIPRMELQAAVLGTRLASFICSSHKLFIHQRFFWTDSKTVLSWLKGDPRKFQQFVMFRVGEILETSHISEWRWIASKLNVADKATKWNPVFDYEATGEWFKGPAFLYKGSSEWPQTPAIITTSEEIRPHLLHINAKKTYRLVDENRFSKWSRMYRSLAYALLFIEIISGKQPPDVVELDLEIIQKSQSALYRQAQIFAYSEEIDTLKGNRSTAKYTPLSRSSPLYKLSPFLDEDDIVRMSGRTLYAEYTDINAKTPIILPRTHRITFLIVDSYHRKFHHCNHETAINEIRQKYYISNLRTLLKFVRRSCQLCKTKCVRSQAPEMANLPRARMAAFSRPFSFTGIDYFGPMFVIIGRRKEKRWGAIFTCLTTRAVHIELAYSLSADSCIVCLKNFMARRGTPLEIYCDNGTNFKGAEKELRDEMKRLNMRRIAHEFLPAEITWKFNPPSAPHMGGAWERLVRSIKDVLYRILPGSKVGEETLRCALTEVENIINSRPLTFVSLESGDDEALTPNHFLLGSSNGKKPPCDPDAIDLRKNWKYSHMIADCFWKRWVKAYLPNINRRSKWFNKARPIQKGDVVIIADENLPRNCWPKGIVVDTVVAADGQVRRAKVQTGGGVFERPAVKLAVLDVAPALSGDEVSKAEAIEDSDRLTGGTVLSPP